MGSPMMKSQKQRIQRQSRQVLPRLLLALLAAAAGYWANQLQTGGVPLLPQGTDGQGAQAQRNKAEPGGLVALSAAPLPAETGQGRALDEDGAGALGGAGTAGGASNGTAEDAASAELGPTGEVRLTSQQEQDKKHLEDLVEAMKAKVDPSMLDKCMSLVTAKSFDSFGNARQDWVVYHSLFRNLRYGEGFYVDVGAGKAFSGSATYFFDVCLGWKGICIEADPSLIPQYRRRTCKLVRNCVTPKPQVMYFTRPDAKGKGKRGKAIMARGQCLPLWDILKNAGLMNSSRRIDLVNVDLRGREFPVLRCFPFDRVNARVWLVRSYRRNLHRLHFVMGRAGFWTSPALLATRARNTNFLNTRGITPEDHFGFRHSNVYVRWAPPDGAQGQGKAGAATAGRAETAPPLVPLLVLGPDFRRGHPLHGSAFLPPCLVGGAKGRARDGQCPVSIPTLEQWEYKNGAIAGGECRPLNYTHRLSLERNSL